MLKPAKGILVRKEDNYYVLFDPIRRTVFKATSLAHEAWKSFGQESGFSQFRIENALFDFEADAFVEYLTSAGLLVDFDISEPAPTINNKKPLPHSSTKERLSLAAPIGIDLKITNKCNLKCKHCIAESGLEHENEFNDSEILDLIENISNLGIFYLGLTGGEPFSNPSLPLFIKKAHELGLSTGITTNGTLIDNATAKLLKENDVSLVRVSIDAANADEHDFFRGVPGAFDKACKGIMNLVEYGVPVTVLTVVSQRNFRTWKQMIELCASLGVKSLNTYLFVPAGRGREIATEALTPKQHFDFLYEVAHLQTLGSQVRIVTDTPLLSVVKETEASANCPAGMFELFIKENGDVAPCPYFPMAIGNVRENSLIDIWSNSQFLRDLRNPNRLPIKCKNCQHIQTCFGGCRAAAYCSYGSISESDPNCWLEI